MQNYSSPSARDVHIAAEGKGTATGKGTLNDKVNVPLPGTNKTQSKESGGVKQAPKNFNGGLINGKI